MNVTLDFSSLPIFFILFYIIFPVTVFFFGGKFWANVYMIASSVVGAMVAAAMPLAFVDLVMPDVLEPFKEYYVGLAAAVLKYGSTVFAGIVFFLLILLQHAIIKLIEATGWIGTE